MFTKMSTSLKLLQLKAENHWTDKSFKQLLGVLKDVLPLGNVIPKTTYVAKKVVSPLGLKFEKIHACQNDCILFQGEYAKLIACPKCKIPHYKQTTEKGADGVEVRRRVPRKFVWQFPLIHHMKHLFATAKDAQLLTWHSDGRKEDNYIRHPADGIQWWDINSAWPNFAVEPRNLKFALSIDGLNPFGNMSSSHSVWLVLLTIYNLAPWLCNQRRYMMMTLLISVPHQPGVNIDTYLRLVVDEF